MIKISPRQCFRAYSIIDKNMHIIDKTLKGDGKMKKSAILIMFVYIILTVGGFMFLNACGSSYNRLSEEKIVPFSASADERTAEIKILGKTFSIDISETSPESRSWLMFYLAVPDDIRISCCISYYIAAFFP